VQAAELVYGPPAMLLHSPATVQEEAVGSVHVPPAVIQAVLLPLTPSLHGDIQTPTPEPGAGSGPAMHCVRAVNLESVQYPVKFQTPPFAMHVAWSLPALLGVQEPEISAEVRLLWWVDMPAGAANAGTPPCEALSTADPWQRLQTMPNWSQEEYLFASPLTPPARLTLPFVFSVVPSHVTPGKDFSGSFARLPTEGPMAASLVQPVVWQRPQE